jgi:hypothetical protein
VENAHREAAAMKKTLALVDRAPDIVVGGAAALAA